MRGNRTTCESPAQNVGKRCGQTVPEPSQWRGIKQPYSYANISVIVTAVPREYNEMVYFINEEEEDE